MSRFSNTSRYTNQNTKRRQIRKAPKNSIFRLPPEIKFLDYGIPVTTITNAPTASIPGYYQASSLNLIVKGDGNDQREGSRINALHLNVVGELIVDKNSAATWATVVNSDHHFRVVVYLDKQCNQALAPITNIFDFTLSASEFQIGATRNLEFIDRFTLLYDKYHKVPAMASTWDGANFHFPGAITFFEVNKSINAPITYTDNLLNVASVTSLNIGMIVMTSASAVTQRKLSFRSRLNFVDY